jgi:hypothetical protein
MKKRKIMLAVPTDRSILQETVHSLVNICYRNDVVYLSAKGAPLDQFRNGIVRTFMQHDDCTHLMMMDSDITPPSNIVDLLLECDCPMAGALVPINLAGMVVSNAIVKDGDRRVYLTSWGDKKAPFEVDALGTGCVLIERKVFEAIEWPWFKDVLTADGERTGEDIYFSDKAKKAGFTHKVHPKAVCGHIKSLDLMTVVKGIRKEGKPIAN